MAAFIAKQMMGNQLSSVKGAIGGDKDKEEGEKKDGDEEEDPEIAEAKREEAEKRKEKYRKIEEEREKMRQDIRDKYGIKKKEEPAEPVNDPTLEGRLGRKKKDPSELEAEANGEAPNGEAANSVLPKNLNDFTSKVSELPGRMMTSVAEVKEKCILQ